MKSTMTLRLLFVLNAALLVSAAHAQQELKNLLATKDSLLYGAIFTHSNISVVENMLAKDCVFYQDQGYAGPTNSQSRETYIAGIQKMWEQEKQGQGDPMRREVVGGSLDIFPVNSHEAIQIGTQHFYLVKKGQKDQLVEESKFYRVWHEDQGDWKMAREMDYLYNANLNSTVVAPPPVNPPLYNDIAHMDSAIFDAFNTQDMEVIKKTFAKDAEFYQDNDGFKGYDQTMEGFASMFERNKNTGLRRLLVPGSLEVYPIKDYGAIEIGEHQFCHKENGRDDCGTFKFVIIWKKRDSTWQLTRTISYGHTSPISPAEAVELNHSIAGMDSLLSTAMNTQNLETLKKVFSPDVAFYQDNEGVENYQQTIKDFKDMFATYGNSGLTRSLVPGSLQVYPIKGYGAIEIGRHQFCHKENGQDDCGAFNFVHVWQRKDGEWKIARVVSYGH